MLNKDALEYLVGLGYEEEVLVSTENGLFTKVPLTRVKLPKIETLKVSNLTSVIDFIKTNIDDNDVRLLIQVVSPGEVRVLTPIREGERDEILRAVAILPNNIRYDSFIDTEMFNIMLQSSFADNNDKDLLLKFTGLIRDEAVKETGDNGVSQKVTIKTGITTVGEAVVPNPVILAPYRTFPEIEQVESKFIFRMQEGSRAALYEADGGAWKNEVMRRIKEFLAGSLEELKHIEIIS
ncbi:hypothetical protein RBU61_14215 [Tissierella sp. MB52-C2]|uniref:hypothetical protein n=1 Tax=Tissierella sp. MB52-C2 TaxID=3070999 RepID=UPI00280BB277|nr:hypothetical protein [Tissierella sp. MB52-C2]WMM24070.1 hypothetical protein RBU61_14215 [Tissierella sp. MB52-C2]